MSATVWSNTRSVLVVLVSEMSPLAISVGGYEFGAHISK